MVLLEGTTAARQRTDLVGLGKAEVRNRKCWTVSYWDVQELMTVQLLRYSPQSMALANRLTFRCVGTGVRLVYCQAFRSTVTVCK
jgi:hypothetical protein